MVNGGLRIVSGHETRRDEAGASHCPSMGSMDSVSLLQLLSQLTSHLSDRYWRQSVSKYSLIVLKPISSSCGQLLLRNLLGRMPEYRDRGETLCYQNLNNTADCRIEVIETYHRGSPPRTWTSCLPWTTKAKSTSVAAEQRATNISRPTAVRPYTTNTKTTMTTKDSWTVQEASTLHVGIVDTETVR